MKSVSTCLSILILAASALAAPTTAYSNLAPNGMLEKLNSGASGPDGWTYEVKSGTALWPIEGSDGGHCLLLRLADDGSGFWQSDEFALAADTEYALSVTYRYDAERFVDPGAAQIVDVETGDVLGSKTLFPMRGWTRLVILFRPKAATQAKVKLNGRAGHSVYLDDITLLPASAVVQPQSPEGGSVIVGRAPKLTWWQKDGAKGSYQVVVASNPQMTSKVSRFTVAGKTRSQLPATYNSGTWFWTVIPSPKKGESEAQLLAVSEVRSFQVVKNRGNSIDTTPPHIYALHPPLDSANSGSPIITGKWLERGPGVDVKSFALTIDGRKLAGAKVKSDGFSLQSSPLSRGRHVGRVSVSDKAGNRTSAVWQFFTGIIAPGEVKLDPNGWMIANGLPFFPIFHYTYTYRDADFARDGDYADAGFNTIINCFNLDNALSRGIKGSQSMNPNAYAGKTADQIAEQYRADIQSNHEKNPKQFSLWRSDHPAWLGFWMDEEWKPQLAVPALEAMRKLSPNTPTMPVGYGAWFFPNYPPELVDIMGLDSYPIGESPIAATGDELDRCNKYRKAGQGLQLWAQAFDWYVFNTTYDNLAYFDYQKDYVNNPKLAGHFYRPTFRQLFSMVSVGWIHGVQSAGWWGPGAEKIPAVRENLRECARRSSWLAPILMGKAPALPAIVRTESGTRYYLGQDYQMLEWMEREYQGKRYVILFNANRAPVTFSISVPGVKRDSLVKVLWEDRVLPISHGLFRDVVPGEGTVVYELQERK